LKHGKTTRKEKFILLITLACTCALAFIIRLFSVLRFETMIHEYDPYFNYRSTEMMVENGFFPFHNWFDAKSWYPLGRGVGSSVYPGLMVTAGGIYHFLRAFQFKVDVRQVCVMIGPLFSAFSVLATYFLTWEVTKGNSGAALFASVFIALVPGYISRSVAGSYDNESIAIFCMILTFALWLRSVRTGSMAAATMAALAYLYMVSAWGGYIFVTNLIPLHVLGMILTKRFTHRAYVAYSTYYTIGTLLSMQVSFVNFKPTESADHMPALGIFGLIQLIAIYNYLKTKVTGEGMRTIIGFSLLGGIGLVLVGATVTGRIGALSGRLAFLFNAKGAIPIIASVAEHQPTSWAHYYYDLHLLMLLFPVGVYRCFMDLHEGTLFGMMYGVTTLYFTGMMVRIVLVLSPAACVLGGIALSGHYYAFMPNLSTPDEGTAEKSEKKKDRKKTGADGSYAFKSERPKSSKNPGIADNSAKGVLKRAIAAVAVFLPALIMVSFVAHSIYMAREHYSDPTIVLRAGNGKLYDDFREAYKWISENTEENAKVLSWWDYGYHLSSMANRTVFVDGNTWNNTHISRVGQILASDEKTSYELMREMDVNYVLVIFGGKIGYPGDDINKFIWMIRIAGSTPTGAHISQRQYMTKNGEYRIDHRAPKKMRNSLMYKLCYHNFGALMTHPRAPLGYDLSQNQEVGDKAIALEHLEEAYTSENWIVRVYRVKPPANKFSG
ncbi:hypothetical protein PFISCL1PPCAC_23301, partial [Pristionchus fissidentatus]